MAHAAPVPALVKMRMSQSKKSSASLTHGWLWKVRDLNYLNFVYDVRRVKYLPFSTRLHNAAELCRDGPFLFLFFFIFSTQYRPLCATWNMKQGDDST